MKNIFILSILIFLISISLPSSAQSIKMVLTLKKDSKIFKTAEKLIDKINQRAGLDITLVYLPRKRAEVELSYGKIIQADLARIAEFINPNLIRIQEPIIKIPVFIYSKRELDIKVNDFNSLKHYKVVYVRGTKFIEKNLKGHEKLYKVTTFKQAFKFVAANRADVVIATPLIANPILNSEELKSSGIKASVQPIIFVNEYTFFNKEYKDIAYKFNEALISLKKDGTFDKIVYDKE